MGNRANKLIAALISLASFNPSIAHSGQDIEGRLDRENIAFDMKAYGSITERIGYFARHIQSIDYEGNTNRFTLIDLSYRVHNKLDLILENQFLDSQFNTKLGIGSKENIGSVNLNYAILADLDRDSKNELNLFQDYVHNNLKLSSEIYINFGDDLKLNSVLGRFNLGRDINNKLSIGVFGQGTLVRKNPSVIEPKVGVFLKLNPSFKRHDEKRR